MKKTLAVFALAVIFTACKTKTDEKDNKNMVLVDTTGLSQHNMLVNVGDNKFVAIEKPVETKVPVSKPVAVKRDNTLKYSIYF